MKSFKASLIIGLLSVYHMVSALTACAGEGAEIPSSVEKESAHLRHIRRLTFVGRKSGEAYFSTTGDEIVFQSVREEGNPFYQIYKMNLGSGVVSRTSNG